MNRRDALKSTVATALSSMGVTATVHASENYSKPLCVELHIDADVSTERRLAIEGLMQRKFKGTELDGIPVFVTPKDAKLHVHGNGLSEEQIKAIVDETVRNVAITPVLHCTNDQTTTTSRDGATKVV